MSGPVCHDCGNPYLEQSANSALGSMPAKCPLCGWAGDISKDARVMLTPEGYEEFDTQMQLKKEGKLFYIRVVVKGDEQTRTRVAFDLMKIVETQSTTMQDHGDTTVVLARVDTRPDENKLAKITQLKGVVRVNVI